MTQENMRSSLGLDDVPGFEFASPGVGIPSAGNEPEEPRDPVTLEIVEIESDIRNGSPVSDHARDYLYARDLLHAQLLITSRVFAESAAVAIETGNPRSIQSFNETASALRNMTQDLLGLQKAFTAVKKEMANVPTVVPETPNSEGVATVGKVAAAFVGTHEELMQLVSKVRTEANREKTTIDVTEVKPK